MSDMDARLVFWRKHCSDPQASSTGPTCHRVRDPVSRPGPCVLQNGNIAIKIAEMERESAAIKRKAASLAVPSTFAQSAKIERQAIALDKEIERLRAASKNISPLLNLTQV